MSVSKIRRHGSLCWLVLMALVLVAVPAVPARADHAAPPGPVLSGTGNLAGTEMVEEQGMVGAACFQVSRHVFGLRGVGTYHGVTQDGQEVVYRAAINQGQSLYADGPLQVEVENAEMYYHGPFGTHGPTGAGCDPATAGAPVSAKFRIFAPGNVYRLDDTGAQVPCTGQGRFARTGSGDNPNWRAEWTLGQDCVVVGNEAGTPGTGVAPAGTAHTHHGTHGPCFGTCVDNFKVDYAQYLPVAGPFLSLDGPASAQIGENVTLTARLADDGTPAANVPVSFAVTGAGPGAPPAGTALTGADGRASFSFTAATVGDYTVDASATVGAQVVTASHTMTFTPADPFSVTLAGPSAGQTEEGLTLSATVTEGGDPAPAADVEFSVAGPGQATPAAGSATTDADGRATFTFAGDRAGEYTVTASAARLTQQASATHQVRLEINTFYREAALTLPEGEVSLRSAVIDPAGDYAYFATATTPTRVVKLDLNSFQRVGAITLNSGENGVQSAVIDPAGDYAYFGTRALGGTARVVKVDLRTFQRMGAVGLDPVNNDLISAVIDPAGDFAYFGTDSAPGKVIKIDLATFQSAGVITFEPGETSVQSAVMDPAGNYAYFGANGVGQSAGQVIRVDLASFQRVGAVILDGSAENYLSSAVIDHAGDYAYFGTGTTTPGRIVKVDLNAFQREGAIVLADSEWGFISAVIDPLGEYAYFGTRVLSAGLDRFSLVVKIDLKNFERAHALSLASGELNLSSAVIDPAGNYAYFGTNENGGSATAPAPADVVKVAVSRPPNPALAVADDTYATDYLTALAVPAPGVLDNDGPGLTAHNASDPAGGSVELRPDGSFTYSPDEGFSGTDTFTYVASDGMDYSPPATVSVAVAAAPEGVSSVGGGALGYFTNVSLFGGPFEPRGPDPEVSLPSTGSPEPMTASSPSGSAVYGPATIFESGALEVSTSGTTGPGGSSTASASVLDVGPGPLYGASMASTCTSNDSASSGDTTLSGTRVVVSMGEDWDSEADDEVVHIPDNPAPNTEVHGAIENVGDYFRVVFNEQIPGPDAMTVNAAHMYLEGPTAIGEAIIGQSRCAVAASAPNEAPVAGDDAYSTGADTPLTIELPGVLANDADPEGQALTAAKLVPAFPASPSANWSFPSDPANGALVFNHDGSFTYTPNQGFVGTDSFPYRVADPRGATDEAMVTITVEPESITSKAVADFDGDGDTDRSVFRKGAWYAEGQPPAFFGVSGDIPVPGDYNGDGTIERAIYRNGAWHVEGQPTVFLGNATDVPVPGDYDGNGTTEAAVYRNGAWHIAGQPSVFLGNATDVPVPGDYDGDGTTDRAVYRNGAWHIDGQPTVFHGVGGDIPVPGDYDGNGTTEAAVYRKGAWHVAGQPTVFLGNASDVPVPGDYDANGSTDRGVFRPSAGGWYVQGQPAVFLGVNGDIALPLPQAIYRAFF